MAKTAKTKTEETSEVVSDVGKEVAVNVGGESLLVKVGDGFIVPDFADAMARAIEKDAYFVMTIANRFYHKQIDGAALRAACAKLRDKVFADVK